MDLWPGAWAVAVAMMAQALRVPPALSTVVPDTTRSVDVNRESRAGFFAMWPKALGA
jgi:hypothetical protein